jgi:asparagine synthase (glutamine-hydrolysing)
MSSIFGMYRHDAVPMERVLLEKMAVPVMVRGPDGVGLFVDGPVGLGVARFQTGAVTESTRIEFVGDLAIVADARIDNRTELQQLLKIGGQEPDSEILIRAHRQWSKGAPEHLLGAFGYALWDRGRQILTVVRDQIGVRPIYLAQADSFTAFATDPRSLLALPDLPKDIDDHGIAQYFFGHLLVEDKETTCYAAIKRLPPAHLLEITKTGEKKRQRYWSPDPNREINLACDTDYAEAFLERFTRAVSRCLTPAGNVGSTLSGGLDSSSISMVASRLLHERGQGPLHTFSGVFPASPEVDESEFIRAVALAGTKTSHEFCPGESSPLESVAPLMNISTQPFFAPNLFLASGACQACAGQGLRVLLDGTDGDTAVGHGFDYFRERARARDWSAFASEAHALGQRWGRNYGSMAMAMTNDYALPELRKMASSWQIIPLLLGVNNLGKKMRQSRKAVLKSVLRKQYGPFGPVPDYSFLSPRFIQHTQLPDLLGSTMERLGDFPDSRRAIQMRGLTSGVVPLTLEALDTISSLYGVEYRFPFYDRELIEFCLAIPSTQQIRDGWTRWIMRQALSGSLPEKVCWRGGKANMASIHQRGLQKFDADKLKTLVLDFPLEMTDYVKPEAIEKSYAKLKEKKAKSLDYQLLWQFFILNSWLSHRKTHYL